MKYCKEEIEIIVKESFSIAECLRKLNKKQAGGNYISFKNLLNKFEIDTSHFTGQIWNKGKKFGPKEFNIENLLILDTVFRSTYHLKNKLISKGLKEEKCENCQRTKWNDRKIPLELEHVNGNRLDNRIENLKLLCPNCHAQTEFYRGKNKGKKK